MNLDQLAQFLGATAQDVTTALRNGESLTQIARAYGRSRDDVKAFLFRMFQDYVTQNLKSARSTASALAS